MLCHHYILLGFSDFEVIPYIHGAIDISDDDICDADVVAATSVTVITACADDCVREYG